MATTSFPALVFGRRCDFNLSFSRKLLISGENSADFPRGRNSRSFHHNPGYAVDYRPAATAAARRRETGKRIRCSSRSVEEDGGSDTVRGVLRLGLWTMEAVYILWLFLLPYAPGDPVWAITSETISSLIGLSLNFFFILPLTNAVGIHLIEAPVLHPMSEGLFNFVIGWTLMFAPLLYTDRKRDRYKGSLDVLWGFQMFLTNTFLIPYMAIRMNETEPGQPPKKTSKLGSIMIAGAPTVGLIGAVVCLLSILWSFFGRMDGDFGSISERWEFLVSYVGTERLAYAFIWDIALYTVFQPWLIGDNLENIKKSWVGAVGYLRFVPVFGLVVYLVFLDRERFDSS